MEEEELEQLMKEQKGEVEQETAEPEEAEPTNAEEKKHLRSVTLTCVGINSNSLKS